MNVNPNPLEDTSIPYHDMSVMESIAKHFYCGNRTGAEAIAELWKQIAEGKIYEICTRLALPEPLGLLHAANTLSKNLFINGYLDKKFEKDCWVDYRYKEIGYGELSLKAFVRDGFTIVKNAVSEKTLREYESIYTEEIQNSVEETESYLSSRLEFNKSQEIVNVICSDFVEKFCDLVNRKYAVQMVEARIGSSRISWHRDDHSENDSPESPNMFGVLVALKNHEERAGLFNISPESHKFNEDKSIINKENLQNKSEECFKYFHNVVNSLKRPPFRFAPVRGDAIIWHGKSIHCGVHPDKNFYPEHISKSLPHPTRSSIIAHYVGFPKFGSGGLPNAKKVKENSNLFLVKGN